MRQCLTGYFLSGFQIEKKFVYNYQNVLDMQISPAKMMKKY